MKGRTCGDVQKSTPTTDEIVRELWDRQQISDVMLRFGRGLDLHDWDMYAATLTDPFEVDFFDLTGRPPAIDHACRSGRGSRVRAFSD